MHRIGINMRTNLFMAIGKKKFTTTGVLIGMSELRSDTTVKNMLGSF